MKLLDWLRRPKLVPDTISEENQARADRHLRELQDAEERLRLIQDESAIYIARREERS